MQGSANLNLMIKAARKAGRSLVKDFREVENLQVSTKGPGDFVTKADREAERIIKEELMGGRPTYGWLGEETGGADGRGPDAALDRRSAGRHHELPARAAALGGVDRAGAQGRDRRGRGLRRRQGRDVLGRKGRGRLAERQRRLRVSGRRTMIEAIFATGVPFGGKGTLPATLQDLARLMPVCAGVRRWGAAALDLAYVAAGRYDGYWERGICSLGHGGGHPAVREAGGFVERHPRGRRPAGRRVDRRNDGAVRRPFAGTSSGAEATDIRTDSSATPC